MSTKTLAKSRVALAIIVLFALLFLIQTGENKMTIGDSLINQQGLSYEPTNTAGLTVYSTGLPSGSGLSYPAGQGITSDGAYSLSAPTLQVIPASSSQSSPTSTNNAPVDPYSTQQRTFLNSLSGGLSSIHQNGADAFTNGQNQLQGSANNILSGFKSGQQAIDLGRQNNELGRMNASQDLLGYIRSGLRQGGSRIASMNAMDSSAPDALAKAYNLVGSQKQRSINNSAAVTGRNLDATQNNLKTGYNDQMAQFNLTRDNLVNQISQKVRDSLAALNQQAVGLSLPDQINVEQQKQQIIDAGMGQLQGVDSWLQQQIGTVNPMSNEQISLGARDLQQAGTGTPNQYGVNPIQQQMIQGPQLDQMPLYSARKYQNQ